VVAKSDVKLRHLVRDPRAVLMIFETVAPFRGVKVRADAEVDDSHVDEVRRAISSRYLGPETRKPSSRSEVKVSSFAFPRRRPRCGTSPRSCQSRPGLTA
jgi:hypothetical protein